MATAETQAKAFYACDTSKEACSPAALSGQKILRQCLGLTAMEQMKAVNCYFNRWPCRLDIDV